MLNEYFGTQKRAAISMAMILAVVFIGIALWGAIKLAAGFVIVFATVIFILRLIFGKGSHLKK